MSFTAAAIAARIIGPKAMKAIPWRAIAWGLLLAGLAVSVRVAIGKHAAAVSHAYRTAYSAGADAQAAKDKAELLVAWGAAKELQGGIIAANDKTAKAITERTSHESQDFTADIARRADDKRRLQAARIAASQRNSGGAGKDGTAQISSAAGGNHAADASNAGRLSFEDQLAMAVDAELDADQARRCSAWIKAQADAWPKED